MSVVQGDDVTLADLVALNYTILIPYNASIPTGGDSLTDNLNLYYTVSTTHVEALMKWGLMPSQSGDIAWVCTSTALVLLMIPGVG